MNKTFLVEEIVPHVDYECNSYVDKYGIIHSKNELTALHEFFAIENILNTKRINNQTYEENNHSVYFYNNLKNITRFEKDDEEVYWTSHNNSMYFKIVERRDYSDWKKKYNYYISNLYVVTEIDVTKNFYSR